MVSLPCFLPTAVTALRGGRSYGDRRWRMGGRHLCIRAAFARRGSNAALYTRRHVHRRERVQEDVFSLLR